MRTGSQNCCTVSFISKDSSLNSKCNLRLVEDSKITAFPNQWEPALLSSTTTTSNISINAILFKIEKLVTYSNISILMEEN